MDMLVAMDQLLAGAAERGETPVHWVLSQDEWLEIGERFKAGRVEDPTTVGSNKYKDVPVHFSPPGQNRSVGLMTTVGLREAED